MNPKTPAEQQIEFLKKLKQSGGAKSKSQALNASPASAPKIKRKKSKSGVNGLFFSPEAQRHLQAIIKSQSQHLAPDLLGLWVVELLSKIPMELALANESHKIEFFGIVQDWCRQRGIKD